MYELECRYRNPILDGNAAWNSKIRFAEVCRICAHVRCGDCIDVDEGDYPMQHCDGAIVLNWFDESVSWKHLEYVHRPGHNDGLPLFDCPYMEEKGCQAKF